ncbi:hypothetical protein LWC33_16520 [Pseudonocardia sp. RS11V-5]|uniref:hypothetical protein n=1 Tax=Pseudonocardia terrae TaxID=2905831 RepID=UPI001E4D36BE|nr:hypothetical protein [Pseudonocardia terrae]MCE3553055.1 hypothetical protein [Pseudonocardia terrae]
MGLRLPLGEVTVILGPPVARRRLMSALDEDRTRCADGHEAGAVRLTARVADPLADRMARIELTATSDERWQAPTIPPRSVPPRNEISTKVPQCAWSPPTVIAPAWQSEFWL